MRYVLLISCIVVSGLLTACMRPLDNDFVDWEHGARAGTVLEPLTPQAAKAELASCLPPNVEVPLTRQYVRVRYRLVRLHHKAIASAPLDMVLHHGDKVEVWPGDCSAGKIANVERLLPARINP